MGLLAALAHALVQQVCREEGGYQHACTRRKDRQNNLKSTHMPPPDQRKASIRPPTSTPVQASNTNAATSFATTGASSPGLRFHTRVDSEKYRTAIAPIVMKAIFGAKA